MAARCQYMSAWRYSWTYKVCVSSCELSSDMFVIIRVLSCIQLNTLIILRGSMPHSKVFLHFGTTVTNFLSKHVYIKRYRPNQNPLGPFYIPILQKLGFITFPVDLKQKGPTVKRSEMFRKFRNN